MCISELNAITVLDGYFTDQRTKNMLKCVLVDVIECLDDECTNYHGSLTALCPVWCYTK